MKIFTLKHSFAIVCAAFLGSVMFQSCSGGAGSASEEEIAILQRKLDSTMELYSQVKAGGGDFDTILASKDSVINAQAAEIQRLINDMKDNRPAPTADAAQLEQQRRQIAEKENRIRQLQQQIERQTQQINALQNGNANNNTNTNTAEYTNRIAELQRQIKSQERQIADLNTEIRNLQQASAGKTECERVANGYKEQIEGLNREANGYKQQIADLNKQITALQAQIENMRRNAGNADAASAAELQRAQNELAELRSTLAACREQSTRLQNDLNRSQNQYNTTAAELEQCRTDLAAQVAQLRGLQADQAAGGRTESQLRGELAELTQREAACRAKTEELTNQQQALTRQYEKDKLALQASIENLKGQIATMQSRIDQLTIENNNLVQASQNQTATSPADARTIADLNAQVEAQRLQIAQLQADLQQKNRELQAAQANNNTPATAGTVNQKLAELQTLCESYAAEITRLRAENEALRNENAELKDRIASEASIFAENERLQQKVRLASVLVTSDMKVTPGKSFKGNVVKPTNKAAQTKVVRIDCRILDNNVVDPGSITIYARIASANNRVLCNGNADNYMFDLNGTQMQYTVKQDIEFTGLARNLTMLWKINDSVELAPGLYWVTLYANGYEIGKVSFKLD
ncbi:MAG: hypothetical protein J5848_05145 [Bacteroidales bacterium]|nr:hypothetical protein [Bacteroidales bacterium]